jgi:hypothetical protein
VNRALFRLIVLTCNTCTETMDDSTVDLNGDVRETMPPAGFRRVSPRGPCAPSEAPTTTTSPGHTTPERGAARRTTGGPGTMTGHW